MGTLWRTLLLCLLVVGSTAHAVEEADRSAIRGLIEGQIEAFRNDDAAAAFAAAAPVIQRMFSNRDRFMAMVRESYRPVYRQRSYSFGTMQDTVTGPMQQVRIQDEEGVDWLAVYTLERQPDGSWRISGCILQKQPGQPA